VYSTKQNVHVLVTGNHPGSLELDLTPDQRRWMLLVCRTWPGHAAEVKPLFFGKHADEMLLAGIFDTSKAEMPDTCRGLSFFLRYINPIDDWRARRREMPPPLSFHSARIMLQKMRDSKPVHFEIFESLLEGHLVSPHLGEHNVASFEVQWPSSQWTDYRNRAKNPHLKDANQAILVLKQLVGATTQRKKGESYTTVTTPGYDACVEKLLQEQPIFAFAIVDLLGQVGRERPGDKGLDAFKDELVNGSVNTLLDFLEKKGLQAPHPACENPHWKKVDEPDYLNQRKERAKVVVNYARYLLHTLNEEAGKKAVADFQKQFGYQVRQVPENQRLFLKLLPDESLLPRFQKPTPAAPGGIDKSASVDEELEPSAPGKRAAPAMDLSLLPDEPAAPRFKKARVELYEDIRVPPADAPAPLVAMYHEIRQRQLEIKERSAEVIKLSDAYESQLDSMDPDQPPVAPSPPVGAPEPMEGFEQEELFDSDDAEERWRAHVASVY
jgi:hypothetical protein